jgi:hypothetical protein
MASQEIQTTTFGKWLNVFVLIAGLGMAAFFGMSMLRDTNATNDTSNTQTAAAPQDTSLRNTTTTVSDGIVLGESDISFPGALTSENYTLGQLSVGGDVTIVSSDSQELGPLEVGSVRGEAFMDKDKKDVNVLITWKTTKIATATITYGKNGADTNKTLTEDGYGRNHSIILSGLDQASAYVYTITAKDRFGKEVATDPYAVYTGTKSTSLFDLIAGAVTDTFGWAIKK